MLIPGNILEIHLGDRASSLKPYPERWINRYLAGRGFNVAWLFEHLSPGTDPLGPENPLLYSCGLLTGKTAPASSRVHVNSLSPLTGILGSSNVGGQFGVRLRGCGIQALIIQGRSDTPVYLYITENKVEFRPAGHLWGCDTWETQERLRSDLGDEALQVLAIGPAGEKGVGFACILTDRDHAAGRTGMGAVMGSKNLKAIVVKDPGYRHDEAQPGGRDAIRKYVGKIRAAEEFKNFSRYGGAGYVKWADDRGIGAVRNFRDNHFEAIDRIDGRRLDRFKVQSKGCYRCPVRCKAELDMGNGATRPEFESMMNLGPKCGLDDLEAIVRLDNLCSRLGIDIISAGNAVAFAMDLFERKILSSEDCGGLDLSWGNAGAMEALIRQIADREALGAVFSQGVRRAAEIIGKGAEAFAPHVKGLELAAYHPAYIMGTALGYATSGRGGDFSSIYASLEYTWPPEKAAAAFGTPDAVRLDAVSGKAALIRRAMCANAALDSLGLCKVPALSMIGAFDLVDEAELASALTGSRIEPEGLLRCGERVITLERLLNIRFGAGTEDDRLPLMFSSSEYAGADAPDIPERVKTMVRYFYREMGWDVQGRPTAAKLSEMGIDHDNL